MLDLRNHINDQINEAYSLRINNLVASIDETLKALNICKLHNFEDLKAKCFSKLSLYYMIIGKYDESFNYAQKGISLYEKFKDEIGIADIKYNLAGFYYKTNDIQIGVVHLIDALVTYKKFNKYYSISKCEKALASIYDYTGDFQKAIQCHKNAIKAAKKINDNNLESNANIGLSSIYIKNDNTDLAYNLIEKCINVKQESNDLRGLAFAIYGRGKIYFAQKKYDLAENDFIKSMEIHIGMGEKLGLAMVYNKLAKLHFELQKIELAKKYAYLGMELCNYYTILIIKIKINYLFYLINKFENNTQHALEYLESYILEREKIINIQNLKVIENYDLLVTMQIMQKEAELQNEKSKNIVKINKIEQESRVRQEFLSTMSHELRTPLNAVITIASLLSEEKDIKDKSLIESLTLSSNHLMQIINDILDFTKIDLGIIKLDPKPSDLRKFISIFSNTFNIQANTKGLDFKLFIDEKLNNNYFIDETKIIQILGNLLNNAIKFTDKGYVNLEITLTKDLGNYDILEFKISDSGIGIERENLEKIFKSFSQIKTGITRSKDGAGLGLSISKKLIELYNSKIKVKSILSKGSVFSFELKLEKIENLQPLNNNKELKNDLNTLPVLLAEDNAINALVATKLLKSWGFEVELAKNGLEATEKSKLKKYYFILMDIHMPVLDGFEATKNIRTLENLNKETPIFALTADISATENSNYNFYFNDFLLKPLEIEKLKKKLNVM